MGIADRIKEARKAKKLTQQELGEMIGIAASTIACYEKGLRSPNVQQIKAIAKALNVDGTWLLETTIDSDTADERAELMVIYDSLNDKGKAALIKQARYIASDVDYKKESSEDKAM